MQILRPHWSYSQLAQFLRCPLQYFFERIARLPRPSNSSGLVLGRAVHGSLAQHHQGLQSGHPLSRTKISHAFREIWKLAANEKPVQYQNGETEKRLIEVGLSLLAVYLEQPAPCQIMAVEQLWLVPLVTSDGRILEKPLAATIDLVTQEDDRLLITEIKTSSRRYSLTEVEMAHQATAYSQVFQQRAAYIPAVRFVVLVKTNKPAVQSIETTRSEAELLRLGDLFDAVDQAITARCFYPIESPQNCTACPYRLPCRQWQRTQAAVKFLDEPQEAITFGAD